MTEVTKKSKTVWRAVLIASLALNVMVAGVVIGGLMGGKTPRPFGAQPFSFGPAVDALNEDGRRAMRDAMRESGAFQPMRPAERNAAAQEFLAAMRADPFDMEKVRALFVDQRTRADDNMRAAQDLLLQQFTLMTHDERVAYADRLASGAEKDGRGGPPPQNKN